jgi:hypothetical protein
MQNDRLFFPYNDGDDLEDLYEELLFEDKQFFTNIAVVPSVLRARLEKIKKREEAYRRITGSLSSGKSIELNLLNENSFDLLQNYSSFQQDRSIIMQHLFHASDCNQLVEIINQFIDRYLCYLKSWKLEDLGETNEILISKELDPSELFKALKAFSEAGGKKGKDIQSLFFDGKSLLNNEAKRLSLLLQKEIQ